MLHLKAVSGASILQAYIYKKERENKFVPIIKNVNSNLSLKCGAQVTAKEGGMDV